MDLDTLASANFSKLGEAITDWQQMTKKLHTLQVDAENNLKKRADKASWAGVNATVSRAFITKTAGEFADAHTQAQTITRILSDTRDELAEYSRQLNEAMERGRKKNMSVFSNGHGTFTVTAARPASPSAPATGDQQPSQQEIEALRTEIQGILTKATESDNTAAEALRLLVDQAGVGFSDARYKDRDSAAKAIKAAKEAAALYRQGSGMSNDQLMQLNRALAAHKNDPLFAEQFARSAKTNDKSLLSLYADILDDRQFYVSPRSREGLSADQKERMKILGNLEKQLGGTLATASHSDSPAMRQWKSDLIANGGTDVRPAGQNRVYGFQVMSNLMRHGSYESDFLHDYGTQLIDYEKKHTSDEYGGLQRRVTREDVLPWDTSGHYERLHYGAANDAGQDPMTGFMEALGHNADASTEFFNEGKNFDYLTESRDWPEDHAESGAKHTAGYNALGHALESATTGAAYDAHPPQLHRDAETANIAEKIVELYGQDAEYKDDKQVGLSGAQLLQKQEGMGDSLGKIAAAYVDDINWALDEGADKSLFAMSNGERTSLGERAHFDTEGLDVIKFISTLGQDPDAYADLSTAQQAYTTSLVDKYPPNFDAEGNVDAVQTRTSVRVGAEVEGILDRGRAEEIKAEGVAADKKYNEAIDARIERSKMISEAVTGGLFSLVPEPATGLGAVVVPIVSDQAESAVGALIEHNLDQYAEEQHRDNAEKYHADASHVYERGYRASWSAASSVLERADRSEQWEADPYQTLSEELKAAHRTGYSSGSLSQQNFGHLPTPSS